MSHYNEKDLYEHINSRSSMYDEHENGMKAWLKYILDSSNY